MHLTQSYIAGCVTNIKPPGYKTKRHDDECMKLLGLPNGFEIAMNFFHTSAKNQSSFKLAPAMSLLPCKHKKVNLAGAKTKFGWCKLTNWMASLGGFPPFGHVCLPGCPTWTTDPIIQWVFANTATIGIPPASGTAQAICQMAAFACVFGLGLGFWLLLALLDFALGCCLCFGSGLCLALWLGFGCCFFGLQHVESPGLIVLKGMVILVAIFACCKSWHLLWLFCLFLLWWLCFLLFFL